jgi:sugar fermentation stimulation protein A
MYGRDLLEAEFIVRENRFSALVDLHGTRERVHVPNSGRMHELLLPGATVLLLPAASRSRKTDHDLVAVEMSDTMVSVDSRVPNAVVAEALSTGALEPLAAYDRLNRERTWGTSRFDFHLEGPRGEALVEVKGCTLVEEEGLALFPDAPTARGARHVRELAEAVGAGMAAYVIVVVQRSDGRLFAPNDRTDPAFGDALRHASAEGVEVMAFLTDVTREGVELTDAIPVDLRAALEAVT